MIRTKCGTGAIGVTASGIRVKIKASINYHFTQLIKLVSLFYGDVTYCRLVYQELKIGVAKDIFTINPAAAFGFNYRPKDLQVQ